MTMRLRSWARRRRSTRWLTPVLDVHERVGELNGFHLAAGVTLMAFLSLFPLLVLGSAVLGFLVAGDAALKAQVLETLGLPPGGETAKLIDEAITSAEDGRRAATIVGMAGLLWAGLGLVRALEYACNAVWQVRARARGMMGRRAFGLLWLAGAGALFAVSIGITTATRFLPGWMAPVNVGAGLLISVVLFVWSARMLIDVHLGWRSFVPGAVVAAVGFEILKIVGAVYVPLAVASASALYGSIGLLFALLAWLFVFARLLVYSATVNVIAYERAHGTAAMPVEVSRVRDAEPTTGRRAQLVR